MFKRKRNKGVAFDTLIGAKTQIKGDVVFAGGLHVDGLINGNVTGSAQGKASLSVGPKGEIEGSVVVSNLVLDGLVKGDIDATERIELGQTARVLGNLRYSVIETAVGAQINGKLIHRTNSEAAERVAGAEDDPPL